MNFKSYIHIDLLKHKEKRLCRNKTETPASHVGYLWCKQDHMKLNGGDKPSLAPLDISLCLLLFLHKPTILLFLLLFTISPIHTNVKCIFLEHIDLQNGHISQHKRHENLKASNSWRWRRFLTGRINNCNNRHVYEKSVSA